MDEELPGPDNAPNLKGADPDLVREELEKGSCQIKKSSPETEGSLDLLGAGQPYKNMNN